jgi:hypothetical protein
MPIQIKTILLRNGYNNLYVLADMEEADVEAIVKKEKMDVLGEIKTLKVLAKNLKDKGLKILLERFNQKQPLVLTSAGPSQPAVMTIIMPPPTDLLKKLLQEFLKKIKGKEAVSTAEIIVKHEAGTMNAIVVCCECQQSK